MFRKHILLIMVFNERKLILLLSVKWFQVLLCLSEISIKHPSFVYIQLNDQFYFKQFNYFAFSLNVKHFYSFLFISLYQVLLSGPERT